MNSQLKQARDAWQKTIDENFVRISISRKNLIDNGFGEMIPDPFGGASTISMKARVSHEQKVAEGPGPGGIGEDFGRYIMTNDEIKVGDIFTAIGKEWRIGVVDQIYQFGGFVGYRAPLHEAGTIEVNT